ncbi:MAG: hypothetical protein OSB26_14760 [Woeseiaceae bacterium]|jgi:hypothetical protein|nr:hypothetical protein [Woeseiaceae bacterium]
MLFRHIVRTSLIFFAIAGLTGCGAPEPEASVQRDPAAELIAFKKAIRAKYDMKEQAFRDNDPEPIVTRFYSDRVISTDNEGATHIGRAGIRPVYEEVIGAFVEIESFNTFVNGDAGWDWANFHVSFPPEAEMEPFTFKMLFLWENIDGEWWSHGEMYAPGEFNIPE